MTDEIKDQITEDDLKIHRREKGFNKYALHFEGTIEDCIRVQQQILQAIQEYPKLKAEIEELKKKLAEKIRK